ncbi:MAG: hypothetical protein NVS3B26_26100 [Mycobacteriales bacterium]
MTTTASDTSRRVSVEQILTVTSAVLLPLGLAMVLLGWYGASHTPYLFEQIPYVISGGLLGVGLAVVGAVVYFASWMARSLAEQRRHNEEITDVLREVREELRSAASRPVPPGRRRSANGATTGSGNGSGPYVATARGSMLHRPDCAMVVGRSGLRTLRTTDDGLTPCTLCSPLDANV